MKQNIFSKFLKFISVFTFVWSTASADQAYIKIGEAKSKKTNLAYPEFNLIGSNKSDKNQKITTNIFTTAKKDLEMSTMFNVMPAAAYLEKTINLSVKPVTAEPNGFKFDSWKTIGAEFLIRTSISFDKDDLTAELFLYDVNEAKLVVGKRYLAKSGQSTTVGHKMANDVLESLTGQRGVFLSKIVASTDRTGHKEVVTMNWDGSDQDMITHDRSVAISPNWSPDGKKIIYSIYTRKVGSAQMNLTLFQHDLNTGKRIIVSNRNGLNSGGTYTDDGKFIYLTISKEGSPDIYKINLEGDIIKKLTSGPAGAMNVEAALSPDGSKIAFSSDRGGKPMIYVMDSDGGNVKRLTVDGKYNSTPSWSADGKKIAFASQFTDYFDVFVMDSDGSNIKRITTATKPNGKRASNEDPSFSPDGRFIAYVSNKTGNFQIYLSNIDGTEEHRITNDNHNYYKPKWSKNIE